ncbi:glutaredoxin family protein [Massilia arenosa]|uniref:Glutaredoxin family protein n=1 Tax=Zemynaea arenosa TaxID=2561931 RepID=A0A4Y9SVA2_9BURK|nr:glutaredoxin family protein [Massilia arenosa]TFW29144.1 glutaredoxin family protein [Massilia arenosa]
MKGRFVVGVITLLAAASAGAQVYKWVDPKGVTHYSDQPPPAAEKKVEVRNMAAGGGGVALPYELAQASRSNPVTLYTTSQCNACDAARKALQERGVPYAEKTVNTPEDQAQLKEAGGSNALPFIVIGATKLSGFEPTALNQALSAARYPAERQLPKNFQFGAGVPASPKGPSKEQIEAAAAKIRMQNEANERNRPVPPKPAFQF